MVVKLQLNPNLTPDFELSGSLTDLRILIRALEHTGATVQSSATKPMLDQLQNLERVLRETNKL